VRSSGVIGLFLLGIGFGLCIPAVWADRIDESQVHRRLELVDVDRTSGSGSVAAERERWDGASKLYAIGILEAADGTELGRRVSDRL
jgi:hypothetical protein